MIAGGKMGALLVKISFFLFSVVFISHLPLLAFGAAITDIRFWSAPDHSRVVLDLTEPVQYESSSQENPPQCQIELSGITSLPKKREFEVKDKYLLKISLTDLQKGKARLVLSQKIPLQVNIFSLKPNLNKPQRLVIDLIDVGQEKKEQEERQKQKEIRTKGTKIVVIDPGHGGEDPGAIGSRKTMEKDIVLKVGEKMIHLLESNKEIKAFLTRKGDYFVPLEERVRIAREYGADLFISLHTDGSFNVQVRGSSAYCLSLSGATDQAAKLLADKENMSNILGGSFLRPASFSKDPNLNQILVDLMQNNTMKESFRFAEAVLDGIKEINHLKYPVYRQANFIVLRAPDMPSVLVEMAFITNKEDERLLNQSQFQEKISNNLVTSIFKHFR